MKKGKLARPPGRRRVEAWTRIDDYLGALLWRSRSRRRHRESPRTEPQEPRLLLSTLPFLALIAALLVLVIGIAWLAMPGRDRPQPKPPPSELGTAPPGWIDRSAGDRR